MQSGVGRLAALIAPAVLTACLLATALDPAELAGAGPTTTAAGATTAPRPTTTANAPSATVATPTTTIAGPPPRPARRVPVAVDSEKIRPVSLPWRTIGVSAGVAIVALMIAGFVYGKIRSRVPTITTPQPPAAGPPPPSAEPPAEPAVEPAAATAPPQTAPLPPASPLPPPQPPKPLPPPEALSEWAPPSEAPHR